MEGDVSNSRTHDEHNPPEMSRSWRTCDLEGRKEGRKQGRKGKGIEWSGE
jgi:hypothetical protein